MVGKQGRSRRLRPLVLALVAGAAVAAPITMALASATAAAIGNPVITVFGEPNMGVAVGGEFDEANASITGTRATTGLHLLAKGGTTGTTWSFVIKPPPGATLHPGYYWKVQWAQLTSRAAGYAALNITGPAFRCDSGLTGGIDIRDLAVSGSTITRLDLLYEQRCNPFAPALFGEIRIGEPRTAGLIVSSGSILWPARPGISTGSVGTAVPVYVRNPGASPVHVGTASLSGLASGDFTIADNTCTDGSLPPGGSCMFFLRVAGSTRGPRPAVLQLPVGTSSAAIQLDALVRPGTSGLTMQSQSGDFIGQGKSYQLNSANSFSTIYGGTGRTADDSHGLEDDFRTFSDTPWTVDMYPANGAAFAVGTYPNAVIQGPGSSPSRNQLSVSGDGRVCDAIHGSFTVKQATFSPSNGYVQHFDATFIQSCDSDTGSLTGDLKYAADSVTSAAPVTALKASATGSGAAISWANPTSSRYRYTLVRVEPTGSPVGIAAYAGKAVYSGTGTTTVVHGLLSGHTYTIVAYAIDQYGNVSLPITRKITM